MKGKGTIFILSELLLPVGANKLILFIFLGLIRQPAAIGKTKTEVFLKNID